MKKTVKPAVKSTVKSTKNTKPAVAAKKDKSHKQNIAKTAPKKETSKKSVKQTVKNFKPTLTKTLVEKLQQMFFAQKKGEITRSKWSAAVEKAGVTQKELWANADHFNLIKHRA